MENDDYRQQLLSLNSKQKDSEVELLREIIRINEVAQMKERNDLQKTKIKSNQQYKKLHNQVVLIGIL